MSPASPARGGAASTADETVPGHFRPRLTLQTLTRGDGLLGLRAAPGFGPRGAQVTVARVALDLRHRQRPALGDAGADARAGHPAPSRPSCCAAPGTQRVLLQRDLGAEADARDALWASGLRPLPPQALQWRSRDAAIGHDDLWSLPEEVALRRLLGRAGAAAAGAGWQVVVQPGFAHQSVPVRSLAAGDRPGHRRRAGARTGRAARPARAAADRRAAPAAARRLVAC